MNYINADAILPEELLKEIQRHIPGGLVYIPKPKEAHQKWGEKSGSRAVVRERNDQIRRLFAAGVTVHELTERFFLSIDSIKKIVYSKK
ncbi:CD3324 family protein [Paenibacillus illinoisensis]|uniref:CD3324 family protein n=1 Tax=Paenibacillus illinoisensis TaxID=59845 RepID=UPI00203AEE19|nr:CD3324 family protein [Paenibacillus illinoisensis]MCM3206596.1 CD3324 family protein [Paenibacillus illinoisensis]